MMTPIRQTLLLIAEFPENGDAEFAMFEGAASLVRSAFARNFEVVACVDESIAALLAICSEEFVTPPPLEQPLSIQGDERLIGPKLYLAPFWHPRSDAYISLFESLSEEEGVPGIVSDERRVGPGGWQVGLRQALESHPPSLVIAMGGGSAMVQALLLVDEVLGLDARTPKYVINRLGGAAADFQQWRILEKEEMPSIYALTYEGVPLFVDETRGNEELVALADEVRAAVGARLAGEKALDEHSQ